MGAGSIRVVCFAHFLPKGLRGESNGRGGYAVSGVFRDILEAVMTECEAEHGRFLVRLSGRGESSARFRDIT